MGLDHLPPKVRPEQQELGPRPTHELGQAIATHGAGGHPHTVTPIRPDKDIVQPKGGRGGRGSQLTRVSDFLIKATGFSLGNEGVLA